MTKTTTIDPLVELTRTAVDAWSTFTTAARTGSGAAIVETYRDYWRARTAALAYHAGNPDMPQRGPGNPGGADAWRALQDEYQHLTNWAPSIRSGTVVQTAAAGDGARLLTADERGDFERRAEAYHRQRESWDTAVREFDLYHGRSPESTRSVNSAGFAPPVMHPVPKLPAPRPVPTLPGADDFSAALTLALADQG